MHTSLLSILRIVLLGGRIDDASYSSLSDKEWRELFRIAAQQGVLAIVYDVVAGLPKEQQPPRSINLQWALSSEAIENRYEMQRKTSAILADLFAEQNIPTVVMKGLALGTYYPNPAHRECGDLDCWLDRKSVV